MLHTAITTIKVKASLKNSITVLGMQSNPRFKNRPSGRRAGIYSVIKGEDINTCKDPSTSYETVYDTLCCRPGLSLFSTTSHLEDFPRLGFRM